MTNNNLRRAPCIICKRHNAHWRFSRICTVCRWQYPDKKHLIKQLDNHFNKHLVLTNEEVNKIIKEIKR